MAKLINCEHLHSNGDFYIVPEFNDALIKDLTTDKDIIYIKNYKLET